MSDYPIKKDDKVRGRFNRILYTVKVIGEKWTLCTWHDLDNIERRCCMKVSDLQPLHSNDSAINQMVRESVDAANEARRMAALPL